MITIDNQKKNECIHVEVKGTTAEVTAELLFGFKYLYDNLKKENKKAAEIYKLSVIETIKEDTIWEGGNDTSKDTK